MAKQRVVFSGIQPSGNLHIGNYIGAIKHWVEGQADGLNLFCIVDLHAITVPQDPIELREKTLDLAALIIAAGIDPKKSILFVQSHNPDHANLGWVLNCYLSMGQLNRMIQYKEKSENKDFVSIGLFDYPALMAADILLYDTTEVPVGEDQKQHVELTRDVAERFNAKYGDTFILPEPVIPKVGARIMSLVEPAKKMSKSDPNEMATIYLLDSADKIREKLKGATTDSGNKIKYDQENKPGISNLLDIYTQAVGITIEEGENKFKGVSYKEFKNAVAEVVVDFLVPLQEKYKELREGGELLSILKEGAQKSSDISHKKLLEVYEKVGFVKG
ncbi:tryptophan--tRNA ligase [Candidatus Woesebacteria bacterium]|nr:tryptophan--tRNA ligase [Candidatus Woesebacteria bacterium]